MLANRRILIVDDDRASAHAMSTLLLVKGNEVRTASDGFDALYEADIFRPEIILLDIGLPKLNGYEVAKEIKKNAWASDVLLVAVTAWSADEDRRLAMEAGFDLHLAKPVKVADLEEQIAELPLYAMR
jgi:DNA-binding response OmpR family regulator